MASFSRAACGRGAPGCRFVSVCGQAPWACYGLDPINLQYRNWHIGCYYTLDPITISYRNCRIIIRPGEAMAAKEQGQEDLPYERSLEVGPPSRSEEHTSELQSLMRISYA